MKVFVLISLISVAYSALICKDRQEGDLIRHPGNCSKFFQCRPTRPVLFECPGESVFNEFIGACDIRREPCVTSPLPIDDEYTPIIADAAILDHTSSVCSGKAIGSVFPHESECAPFRLCSPLGPMTLTCPFGTSFDVISLMCEQTDLAVCHWANPPIHTSDPTLSPPIASTLPTNPPNIPNIPDPSLTTSLPIDQNWPMPMPHPPNNAIDPILPSRPMPMPLPPPVVNPGNPNWPIYPEYPSPVPTTSQPGNPNWPTFPEYPNPPVNPSPMPTTSQPGNPNWPTFPEYPNPPVNPSPMPTTTHPGNPNWPIYPEITPKPNQPDIPNPFPTTSHPGNPSWPPFPEITPINPNPHPTTSQPANPNWPTYPEITPKPNPTPTPSNPGQPIWPTYPEITPKPNQPTHPTWPQPISTTKRPQNPTRPMPNPPVRPSPIGPANPILTGLCQNQRPSTKIPHPTNCAQFVQCGQSGQATLFTCPRGTYFNPNNWACDWPDNVNCGNDLK